jgi:uroporphyrinogen decarboxylase
MNRVPDFTPSVYEHAAALIGRSPLDVSQSAGLLFKAHKEAYNLYRHSPVITGIDIYNVEAEAYGALPGTPEGNSVPAIHKYPVSSVNEIKRLKPLNPDKDGRLPMIIETGKRLMKALPDADVRIPVSGPFSLAGNLIGYDRLLQDILEDPGSVSEALLWLCRGQLLYCKKIVDNGPGITFFESGATPPLLSPEMFDEIELPVLEFMTRKVSELAGHPVPCIIGGNTAPIIESVISTGTGYVICPSETDQELFMEKMKNWPEIMVRINIKPDGFSSGDIGFVYRELERVLKLATGREKVCLGTGVLPYETNPDMIFKAREFLIEKTCNTLQDND